MKHTKKELTFLADMSTKGGGLTPCPLSFFVGRGKDSWKFLISEKKKFVSMKKLTFLLICALRLRAGGG